MRRRLPFLLVLLLALAPTAVAAQEQGSPPPVATDPELIGRLCEVAAADEAEMAECVASVEDALAQTGSELPPDGWSPLDQAADLADQTLEDLRGIDLQGAIEAAVAEALAATEGFDLEGDIDDALAEALAAIEEADLQGRFDEAVASLEEGIAEAQAIVAEAEAWARENPEVVCRGGSVGLAATVGIAVFATTGMQWLSLQSFWATERFTNATCGDIVGE